MADIEITCPECGNKRAVPDDLVGKKLKCKKCQSIFTVKAPPAAKPTAKPGAKPADKVTAAKPAKPGASVKKDDEDDKNPYTMKAENLAARCPFCAMPLDPPDARICLHCGYDLQKRKRLEQKQTLEVTAADYLLWHLPTLACFVSIGIIIGIVVYLVMNIEEWVADSWMEKVLPSGCWQTWTVVVALFPIFYAGRFIFRRLVWYFHPAEKEVKLQSEDD